MIQKMNQQCNTLQSIIGIFLYSYNTLKKALKTLARIGVLILVNTIHLDIRSLSIISVAGLGNLGQGLLTAYTYNNFDIQLNTAIPIVTDAEKQLIYLTSRDLIELQHNVQLSSIKCSNKLQNSLLQNPHIVASSYSQHISLQSTEHLHNLHPKALHLSGLSYYSCFNTQQFLYDLCHHRPEYFHQLQKWINWPEAIEQILPTKLNYMPAQNIDLKQLTVVENIAAITNLLNQGSVSDPNNNYDGDYETDIVNVSNYAALVHSDLST